MRNKKKVTLTTKALLELIAELEFLLKLKVKLSTKYFFHSMRNQINITLETFREMQAEAYMKAGKPENDKSEGWLDYVKEIEDLLNIEHEIEYSELFVSDLDNLESEQYFGRLFNLINR